MLFQARFFCYIGILSNCVWHTLHSCGRNNHLRRLLLAVASKKQCKLPDVTYRLECRIGK